MMSARVLAGTCTITVTCVPGAGHSLGDTAVVPLVVDESHDAVHALRHRERVSQVGGAGAVAVHVQLPRVGVLGMDVAVPLDTPRRRRNARLRGMQVATERGWYGHEAENYDDGSEKTLDRKSSKRSGVPSSWVPSGGHNVPHMGYPSDLCVTAKSRSRRRSPETRRSGCSHAGGCGRMPTMPQGWRQRR